MKFQNLLLENSTSEQVNEKIKKIKLDSEKYNRQFFRNEVSNILRQMKEGNKK
jgi:hypothetical protein